MKKLLFASLTLLISLSIGTVCAEQAFLAPESGKIVPIESGTAVDLDGDGNTEVIEYEILRDEEGYDTGYRLAVGSAETSGDGYAMNESLYLLRLSEYDEILLLVSDYGPSDDYETAFYLYTDDQLLPAGQIDSMPESMRIENGVITAPVRGKLLYTWYRDADFALAYNWAEHGQSKAMLHEIPRHLYPMSLIVTARVELPLMTSMTNTDVCAVIAPGEEVILCATDDVEWVYIQSTESSAAGWIRAGGETGMECNVGGTLMDSYEVFDGLLFAD